MPEGPDLFLIGAQSVHAKELAILLVETAKSYGDKSGTVTVAAATLFVVGALVAFEEATSVDLTFDTVRTIEKSVAIARQKRQEQKQ